ncbi:pirin family protein [Alicycliphilus denitrificans]|uniref:Pirin family protein n=1 Tax=Alicycliphilus denitrificans TaxID=179636 RepID=A0A3R7IGH4_9BURK|nr:pirin family protein [Alicycliphilus denitrificans]RKJ96937.1 pirin family protein [Alicycliphilus denitrificans]
MTDTFTRIPARTAEIGGGVPVARMLPSRHRRTIGAWCFLDHAGPARFAAGQGLRVGPHPHTGLQTFTWMLEGEVLHRDSLGNEQVIRAGQVNLMTAGRGIAHTEESVAGETRLHTAQLWIALPARVAGMAPRFDHYPDLPRWSEGGAEAVLLAGAFMGRQSPVLVHTPLVGVDWHAPRDAALTLALDPAFEYGLVPLTGPATAQGQALAADELLYLPPGAGTLRLELPAGTRALLIGGAPFGEDITIWWNFVGHGKPYIAQAQRDWQAHSERFGEVRGFDGPRIEAPPVPWAP